MIDNDLLKAYILKVKTKQMKLEDVPKEYRHAVGLMLHRLEESKIRQEENEFHFVDIVGKPLYWFIDGSIYAIKGIASGTKTLFKASWNFAGKVAEKEQQLIDKIWGKK